MLLLLFFFTYSTLSPLVYPSIVLFSPSRSFFPVRFGLLLLTPVAWLLSPGLPWRWRLHGFTGGNCCYPLVKAPPTSRVAIASEFRPWRNSVCRIYVLETVIGIKYVSSLSSVCNFISHFLCALVNISYNTYSIYDSLFERHFYSTLFPVELKTRIPKFLSKRDDTLCHLLSLKSDGLWNLPCVPHAPSATYTFLIALLGSADTHLHPRYSRAGGVEGESVGDKHRKDKTILRRKGQLKVRGD